MDIEAFRSYCLSKKAVTEEFPFDRNIIVFKVMGKMFTAADVDLFESINLKCDPDKAIELRETYEYVRPGWHMNKKHWNTIEMGWDTDDNLVRQWIDDSYDLVVSGLTKKLKEELKAIS